MFDHKELSKAVFKVNSSGGSGSSFYLRNEGIFITNFHVVQGFKEVSVEDINKDRFLAKVIMVNPNEDIAILRTKESFDTPALQLNIDTEVNSGDKVFVAGYPFGMPFTITEGIVSATNQLMEGKHYIQTDAAVNPGNSGGPVINANGEVVGITTAKFNNADNMGFAIPVKTLKEELALVKELTEDKYTVVCQSCSNLIMERTEYCQNCGASVDVKLFDDLPLTALAVFCERAISNAGINPVLARTGNEFWEFHHGSSLIRIFVFNRDYLYATSPINNLPNKNLESLYRYMLSKEVKPYSLGIDDNKIYLSYRVHIGDTVSGIKENVLSNLTGMMQKADALDDYLMTAFDAEKSSYAK